MAKKVWFQEWRIIWFAAKMVSQAKRAEKTDPALSLAYTGLAELAVTALNAAREGRQDAFLKTLDMIQSQQPGNTLAEMLAGTAADVPEWLRKGRK